ncbi:MAG: glycosyltransferase family 2 protein [Clostridiales bacterium]|nr:glycosyltransferase family 2 protein [Clostridiales bacterium]
MGNFLNIIKRGRVYLKNNGLGETLRRTKIYLSEKSPRKYKLWIKNCEKSSHRRELKREPLISVCMPVYNPEIKWLKRAVDSILKQSYENWELCIADDASTDGSVKDFLKSLTDSRINVIYRKENGNISKATNTAAEAARGDFIALLDNDDELAPNALLEIALTLDKHPNADVIYSDEDKIDKKGRRFDPFFKPDFSPHTLISLNYISHLGVYRRELLGRLKGLRSQYDGSQDYDLALRAADITDNFYHIPKVLYHWRVLDTSTSADISKKSFAYDAAKRAIEDTIKRRGLRAEVKAVKNSSFYNIEFKPDERDFVSIIIPVKDKPDITENCFKSIYEKTDFKNFEIIAVDNNSSEPETAALFEKYSKRDNFKVLRLDIPFNFSRLNNIAAGFAKGNILLFLNNDTEVISENWLGAIAGACRESDIGCVGAKLLYPNDTIQHCGIVLGAGGLAGSCGIGVHKNERGYFGRYALNYNYSAVTAACLGVKKSLFEKAGGFDESFAVAFNDVDFCLKVKSLGVNNICLSDVCLYHYESLTRGIEDSPEKIKRFNGEIIGLKEKWGKELLLNDPCYNENLSLALDGLFAPVTDRRARRLAEPQI